MGNIFGGGGKKSDPVIPPPRTDNEGMLLRLHHGTGDPEPREVEALQVLKAYVRKPYFPTDREILIRAVTWEEGRQFYMSRGNPSSGWPRTRTGFAYAPLPQFPDHVAQIHLVIKNLSKLDRIKLAIHEYGHLGVYHYLLTAQQWGQINVWGTDYEPGPYEMFADQFVDYMMEAKVRGEFQQLFRQIEERIQIEGQTAYQGRA